MTPDGDLDRTNPDDDLFGDFAPRSTSMSHDPPGRFDERGRLALKRRRRKHWPRRAVLGVTVVMVLLSGVAGVQLLLARAPLNDARGALEQGASALVRNDVDAAAVAFAQAQDRLDAAERHLGNPAVGILGIVPVAGNSARTARAVAAAAGLLTDAGQELVSGVAQLPDGAVSLAPIDGRIPVEPLRAIAPALDRAAQQLAAAQVVVEASPSRFLVGPVAAARRELTGRIEGVAQGAQTAAVVARDLPAFLGADGERRYYFGAQNPAELRGTGGFIGAFSVMTADRGAIDFDEFRSVVSLTNRPIEGVEAPNPDYAARYARFGGAGFPQNINMTPDFPSAAIAMRNLYAATQGEQVDGVVVADPYALRELLEVTGPVEVPDLGLVTAGDVLAKVATESYEAFDDRGERKEVLGDVAARVFDVFLTDAGRDNPARAVQALTRAVTGGHLLVWTQDPVAQQVFDGLGADGRLEVVEGDYLQVVANNAGANKVDFWTSQAVQHDVALSEDGSATAITTVTLHSDAPTSGFAIDVLGPNIPGLEPGGTFTYLSVYGAPDAHVVDADSAAGTYEDETELGLPVWSTFEDLPAGGEVTVRYVTSIPAAWDPTTGRYSLRLVSQVRAQPGTADVTVALPPGRTITATGPGVQHTAHDRVRWAGRATGTMDLWVESQLVDEPFLTRAVDILTSPLSS